MERPEPAKVDLLVRIFVFYQLLIFVILPIGAFALCVPYMQKRWPVPLYSITTVLCVLLLLASGYKFVMRLSTHDLTFTTLMELLGALTALPISLDKLRTARSRSSQSGEHTPND
jgi:hypothetical protein